MQEDRVMDRKWSQAADRQRRSHYRIATRKCSARPVHASMAGSLARLHPSISQSVRLLVTDQGLKDTMGRSAKPQIFGPIYAVGHSEQFRVVTPRGRRTGARCPTRCPVPPRHLAAGRRGVVSVTRKGRAGEGALSPATAPAGPTLCSGWRSEPSHSRSVLLHRCESAQPA